MRVDKSEDHFYSCSGEAAVKAEFRRLAKVLHPDHGGDPEKFMALVRARDEALAQDDTVLDMIGEEE